MFALFGLGWAELVVIGVIAVVPLFFLIRALPSLLKSAPPPRRRDELADLQAQVADLRDEVERLKKGPDKKDSSDGITADGPK